MLGLLSLPMRVKKLPTIAIFVAGVTLVFTLILTRNFFKTNTAHGDTTQNLVVYADQLSGQVANWSWGSSVNFSNTSPVFSGSNSISFTPNAWGGLYLHSNSSITPATYNSLQFAMQTSDSPNNFTLLFYDGNNQVAKSVKLSQYPGSSQNGWEVYTIPTSIMPSSLGGVALQETSGNAGPTTYVDSIQFVASQTSPSTLSASNSGSSAVQTKLFYTDALASGWVNWSWNSNVNFSNTNPVNQGSNAISFTPTGGYGGLYIHSEQGSDTTPYLALTFAAQASANGQTYAVGVYDTNNQMLHAPIALDTYGGQPVAGSWKVYTIPLSDLNASNKTIKGVMIQDTSGKTGQTLFIDQLGLTASTALVADPQPTQGSATISPPIAPVISPADVTTTKVSGNPLSGIALFNDPDSNPALQQQQQWQSSRPNDAAQMAKIATQPKAIWMGSWNNNIESDVQLAVDKAGNSLPVFVAYNIPGRDCGSYSAGGSSSLQTYESWISSFAQGIGSHRAAIILEPDALAQITCLSSGDQSQRYQMLSYAVQTFKSLGNTSVYLDAGNASWIGGSDMASRLKQAGIDKADGFALNVSNFLTDNASISYGQQVSDLVGGKHFVIDTSRNGNGPAPDNAWCNPDGRALGDKPTTQTGNPLVDAYLWLKYPGESDGSCNGAPAAGVWYPDYALGLAQRASW
jgi:endoglucanase